MNWQPTSWRLLQNSPEEKLILPAMYNLYKIYQITNSSKAEAMKTGLILNFLILVMLKS
jgi:hypothetical protein